MVLDLSFFRSTLGNFQSGFIFFSVYHSILLYWTTWKNLQERASNSSSFLKFQNKTSLERRLPARKETFLGSAKSYNTFFVYTTSSHSTKTIKFSLLINMNLTLPSFRDFRQVVHFLLVNIWKISRRSKQIVVPVYIRNKSTSAIQLIYCLSLPTWRSRWRRKQREKRRRNKGEHISSLYVTTSDKATSKLSCPTWDNFRPRFTQV